MRDINILVACEESQRVCEAFRKLGGKAYSCDIIECSGGHPEWHIMQDVIPLLNGGGVALRLWTELSIRLMVNGI